MLHQKSYSDEKIEEVEMTPQETGQRNVALVIVAHPDDAEFQAAGTVMTWVADGWDVHYSSATVVLTHLPD